MMWNRQEIEDILKQLNDKEFPFKKYKFSEDENGLKVLGKGAFATVYEAEDRGSGRNDYAIKVIGFQGKQIDSEEFHKSVEKQMTLTNMSNHVVQVYDYVEMQIWLDENNQFLRAEKITGDSIERNQESLLLQFVVMEKVEPVLKWSNVGKPILAPTELAIFDEMEILKLAYDIGGALAVAHEQKLLHRDVKLENIFYHPRKKKYQLGDFGIAKTTDYGIASTVAFTKGYGAPEVTLALRDRYDQTADIYSLGMVLYVLLNELKFPESENYSVNAKVQYMSGYCLPELECVSEEFYNIIQKMCKYNPEDRYQSMDEVIAELDASFIHEVVGIKKKHVLTTLVVGGLSFVVGATGLIKPMEFGVMSYIFLALLLWKMYLKLSAKDIILPSGLVFIVGLVSIIQSGFTWWKLLILMLLAFTQGIFGGITSLTLLVLNAVHLLEEQGLQVATIFNNYRWIFVLCISLGCILLYEYALLEHSDRKLRKQYYSKNIYWKIVYFGYGVCILYPLVEKKIGFHYLNGVLQSVIQLPFFQWLRSEDALQVGIVGLIFSVFWTIRERSVNFRL